VVNNFPGRYPTEDWEATYFSVSSRGELRAHRVTLQVPRGLATVCARVKLGEPGCVYGVRRWGVALRPSALAALDFDPLLVATGGDDAALLSAMLAVTAFDLPGEFIIASPEHPFRLSGPDGHLRGSDVTWRSYLGALSFFVSGGRVNAAFIRLLMEAEPTYRQAVGICLAALAGTE